MSIILKNIRVENEPDQTEIDTPSISNIINLLNGIDSFDSLYKRLNSIIYKEILHTDLNSQYFDQLFSSEDVEISNEASTIDYLQISKRVNKIREDKFYQSLKREFSHEMKDDRIEDGIYSKTDHICFKYAKIDLTLFKQSINSIFNENFANNINVILFILSAIAKMEYDDIYPNGKTMVLLALHHENDEVKDAALSAIDSWEAINFVSDLKVLEIKKTWLKDYIDNLIESFTE